MRVYEVGNASGGWGPAYIVVLQPATRGSVIWNTTQIFKQGMFTTFCEQCHRWGDIVLVPNLQISDVQTDTGGDVLRPVELLEDRQEEDQDSMTLAVHLARLQEDEHTVQALLKHGKGTLLSLDGVHAESLDRLAGRGIVQISPDEFGEQCAELVLAAVDWSVAIECREPDHVAT